MGLKKFKPITPGQRFRIISAFDEITTSTPYAPLTVPKKKTGDLASVVDAWDTDDE